MPLNRGQMSSEQRLSLLLNRKPVDRIPFFSFAQGFSTLNTGYSIADYYYDPEKSFHALKATARQYDFADFSLFGYASFGAWEFGGEISWPEGEYSQAPAIKRFPVESERDVLELGLPQLATAGFVPRFIRFAELHEESSGYYTLGIEAPFVGAGNLCSVTRLCRWILKKPEIAHKLLQVVTDFKIELVRYLAERFGTEKMIPWVGDATASNVIISPQMFAEFAMPYTKRLHENILSLGYRHIIAHICGDQNRNYPYWAQIPMGDPGIISVSQEVDLETAMEYFPNDIIMGNITPSIIQAGTAEQVYEEAKKCLEKGRRAASGYMLAPGCELPAKAPPYNVWTIMRCIDDHGRYD